MELLANLNNERDIRRQVGFACAGTGDAAALAMLTPMVSDAVDFVRQGALVASALVLMQQSEAKCPAVKDFREKISALVKNKYPSTLTKIGAILSAGILDAGGRNCCVALQSSQGEVPRLVTLDERQIE